MSYQTTVLADAPLRYYRLGESSGTTATDLGSQGQNGTLSGGITLGQSGLLVGDANTAYLLNGSTGMLSIPTTGLPTGAASWSVECWVQFSAAPSTYTGLISLGTQLTGKELELAFDGSGLPYVGLKNVQGPTGPSPLATDTPHHLVGTYDGTTLHLYVDGTEVGTPLATTPNITYGGAVIGEYYLVGAFFAGIVDEVAIYGTALSASRVLAHYNAAGYFVQTDFYLSPSGSDSNPGTQARPWQTYAHAINTLQPGYTIHFAPGTYVGGTNIGTQGTAGNPITLISDTKWGAKITQSGSPSLGNALIYMYDYWTVDGFEITGPDMGEGIQMSGNYGLVQNCWVHDIANNGSIGHFGWGIGDYDNTGNYALSGNRIIRNRVERIGTKVSGVIVQNSLIHTIYPKSSNPLAPGEVSNNLCILPSGEGISLYHNPNHWLVTNNTIINPMSYGMDCWGDTGAGFLSDHNTVQNNIMVQHDGGTFTGIYSPSAACGTHNIFRNNIVWPPAGGFTEGTSYDIGTQSHADLADGSPGFVNYQADGTGDYHLAAGSVCIDAGTSTESPATDYDGNTRAGRVDVGAYQFTILLPPPVIEWRALISLNPLSSLPLTGAGFGGTVPVGTTSTPVTVRIYNNFSVEGGIASALNCTLAVYDDTTYQGQAINPSTVQGYVQVQVQDYNGNTSGADGLFSAIGGQNKHPVPTNSGTISGTGSNYVTVQIQLAVPIDAGEGAISPGIWLEYSSTS